MISWPSSSFDARLFLIDNRNTGSVPRPHSGRGFSCPIAGHDRGYGSADVVGSDTRRQLPQVKSIYIFRFEKVGNCLGSVGRWGVLGQQWGALFAPHAPEMPINRDFYRLRPWNFCEKRPKLPLVEMSIRGPERKNGFTCLSPMSDCLPFWSKNEKVCGRCIFLRKNAYLCSQNRKV